MKYLALVLLVLVVSLPVLADVAAPPPPDDAPAVMPVPEVAPVPAPLHPEGVEKVPMGVIEGGWAYVYASYGVGLLGLIAYAASLFVRRSETPPPGAP